MSGSKENSMIIARGEEAGGSHNLATLTYKAVSEMIRHRRLNGGDVIVEARLAETLGISRTPLREALQRLEGEGLVQLVEGDDLRNRLVLLTEAGEERLAAALPAWEAAQQKLIDQLGAEKRETLLALLDELA